MAWKVKDSAGSMIERREEPYLTEAMKAEAREKYLPRFETTMGALLPVLHMLQHAYGWIPKQALLETAEFLELTPGDVLDTASFYEEYWLEPKGKHTIAVCRSIACEACGHSNITKAIKDKLGIELHETTDDGQFTLIELECMGACGEAPVALIDEHLCKYVTPESVLQRIDAVSRGEQLPHE